MAIQVLRSVPIKIGQSAHYYLIDNESMSKVMELLERLVNEDNAIDLGDQRPEHFIYAYIERRDAMTEEWVNNSGTTD